MARWPMLVALSFALPGLGCATRASLAQRIVPGLANATSIQRTQPDESVHDVIANGRDVCGRDGVSPLPGHYPPCWGENLPPAMPSLQLMRYGAQDGSLVVPWLQHFYSGWPCALPSVEAGAAIASLSQEPPASSCALP
jgi:hypothetical protein